MKTIITPQKLAMLFSVVVLISASAASASTITRSFSSSTPAAGSALTVTLGVNITPPDTTPPNDFYLIDELVPTGWLVTNAGGGDSLTNIGHIFWTILSGAVSTTYQYVLDVPATASGVSNFSGIFAVISNPNGIIAGPNSVTVIPGVATPTLATINVIPVNPFVIAGNAITFSATTLDQSNNPIAATTTWSSSNTAVGTIDPATRAFTAVSVGTTTITASSGSVTGTTLATVMAATYTLTPTSGANGTTSPAVPTTVIAGTNQTFAIVPDLGFMVQDVAIDGVSVGATTSYTFTNVTASHMLSATFTAIPVSIFNITSSAGANGAISPLGLVQVNSGASTTFTMTPGLGYTVADVLIDGVSIGATTTYTFNNVSVDHTISASFHLAPALTTINLTPTTSSKVVGSTQQYTVNLLDQYGAPFVAVTTWSSNNPGVATIDVNGLATALTVGTTTIAASAGGQISSATLVVTPAPILTTISVTPTSSSVTVGATRQFTATTFDQFGNPFAASTTWASSNPGVATIDATGLATTVGVGTTTITANSGSISGSASLTVTPVPVLTSLNISPQNPTVASGTIRQFTATTFDQLGAPITATVNWLSSNSAVGTIDLLTGVFSALGSGTTTITASSGSLSTSTLATVSTVPTLASIIISPASSTVALNSNLQFTASTSDQFGNPIATTLVWTSSNPTVGTISSSTGVFTASATGTTVISASNAGVTGMANVTVIIDSLSPTIPTNLIATAVSSSQINLGWTAATDNVGVIGYKVYRNGTTTQIATTTVTSFADLGLQPATAYNYTVAAYDAAGNISGFATSTQATTQIISSGGGGSSSGGSSGGSYIFPEVKATTTLTQPVVTKEVKGEKIYSQTELDQMETARVVAEEKALVNKDLNFANKFKGKILIQVESHGQAWYISPVSVMRYFLGHPADAFRVMRSQGLGVRGSVIKNTTLYPDRLLGRILIDVDNQGRAYYINPGDKKAYYLGRPADAFTVMSKLGLGITNSNIQKIEVGG